MAQTTTIEETLAHHGRMIYPNVGRSMLPLLRERRDLMVLERRPEGRLKKYDVVLYRSGGSYIVHRILKVRERDYVICGDHNWRREFGVTDGQILGILTAFVRDGVETPVTNRRYLAYVHLWCDLFYLRAAILWCGALPGRVRRKLGALRRRQQDRD